jgi:ankyrin repeat protein
MRKWLSQTAIIFFILSLFLFGVWYGWRIFFVEEMLQAAVDADNVHKVCWLIRLGAPVETRVNFQISPGFKRQGGLLHWASWKGHGELVELLVLHNADMTRRDQSNGLTALYWAVSYGHLDIAEIFISHGCDLNAKSIRDGSSPLQIATFNNDIEMVKLLLRHGADVNARDNGGNVPLGMVEKKEIAELLLLNGADINLKNGSGNTPLHLAASNGHYDVLELLLLHGSQVNAIDNEGNTPLHHAFFFGYKEIVRILLANGANPNIPNSFGKSPAEAAHGLRTGTKDAKEPDKKDDAAKQ